MSYDLTLVHKKELIRAYCKDLEATLLLNIVRTPKEWDGRHLRNWFWMTAKSAYEFNLGRKEMSALKNEIIVRNL